MIFTISRASHGLRDEKEPCAGCVIEGRDWMIELDPANLTEWIKAIDESVIISPPTYFREHFDITIYDDYVE